MNTPFRTVLSLLAACLGSIATATAQAPAPEAAGLSPAQTAALAGNAGAVTALVTAVTNARTALVAASLTAPSDPTAINRAALALGSAELAAALARAEAFVQLQAGPGRLLPGQIVTAIQQASGRAGRGGVPAEPLNPDDHEGFTPLFDGTLNGWDGNPAVWSIVDGAISADSQKTAASTFLISRTAPARDFELKLKVRMTGPSPGSGIMYRSTPEPRATDNWYLLGYQYDLGGTNTGQVVDQGGRAIVTRPGEATIDLAPNRHVRVATLGGAAALEYFKAGEWNDVHIIARGGTLIHILNGHIVALSVDDDAAARRLEGVFALQVEGSGQLYFKDIWLKRL
jgi:hypothetical protein